MKKKITLRKLNHKKISNKYVSWMNDYEIVKYTEQKYNKHNKQDISNFVKNKNNSINEFLYGVFVNNEFSNNIHIGNIKLGPINFIHKSAEISYFIGDKKYWNKGYISLAIENVCEIAKKKYGLKKIQASVYSINLSSIKVLRKNNFSLEGKLVSSVEFRNRRYNTHIYGLKL